MVACSSTDFLACGVQTEDANAVPLNVTCWPSISPAEAVVSLDYDLAIDFDLQNVVIAIPCPSHPRINQARPVVTH